MANEPVATEATKLGPKLNLGSRSCSSSTAVLASNPGLWYFPTAQFPLQSSFVITELYWPLPPSDWPTRLGSQAGAQHEIHVWAASLTLSPARLEFLRSILANDELERADRFRFLKHRNRFIAGRGLLRQVLGRYLGLEPSALAFVYGPNGKPALPGSAAGAGLEFNLAHSEDLALLALARRTSLGVDVEALRPLADATDLVARFFCPHENELFRQLPSGQQPAAFFNLWTRKEALLKATGEGIGRLLNQVEVSFLPNEPARFRRLPSQVTRSASWKLYTLSPAPGYTGALALAASTARLHCWCWNWADVQHQADK